MLEINKIHEIDVLKGLKQLEDNSCQIIIVDPPYNIGKDFGNNKDKREREEYLKWCDEWVAECIRVLKSNGTMFIYGFSEILAFLFVRLTALHKRWLIWHYTNKNMPTNKFWQRSHESIICCWKGDKPIFNLDDVREPYTEGFLNGSAGKVRPGTIGRLSKKGKETIYNANPKGALPRDVIKIPALAGGAGMNERVDHPTQKPLTLCDKLILSARQKEGLVLVPFVGSGSECVSAKKLGLDFIGFEINPDYIKIAEKRLRETPKQLTL